MSRSRILLGASLLAAATSFAALPPAERLLPADTLGFITAPDWPAARTNFNQSGFGQFLADPEMKPFNEKFMANLATNKFAPLEKELGIKVKDYADFLRGQITLAITRNGWDGQPDRKPGFVWLLDVREKSSQLQTNLAELRKKWVDQGKKVRTEKIRNVDFTLVTIPPAPPKPRPPGSAPAAEDEAKPALPRDIIIGQSASLLVVSDAPKDVEKILALQSGSSVPALADQASFAGSTPLLRDSTLFGWVDVKNIMGTVTKQSAERKPDPPSLFGPPPTFDRILNAMGLSGVGTIGFNLRGGHEGSVLNVTVNVPEGARKGLFRILSVDTKDASPPPFVPADAVEFNRWRIDLQKAWVAIETMLMDISPASGGAIKLILDLAGKDKDPNFDLRKTVLAVLGDDVVSYEKSGHGVTAATDRPSVTLIGAKNAEQLAMSFKALTSIIPPNLAKYSEREFLGRTVYSFTWPGLGMDARSRPFTYAASGGYVAFSSDPALIEEYLRSNEGKSKSLRETPGLNEAAQKVGGMSTGFFSYENQNEAMRETFGAARKDPNVLLSALGFTELSGLMGQPFAELKAAEWFDPNLLPPYDRVAKYFHMSVSAVNVSPTAITFRLFTPTQPQLRQ